MVYHRSTGCVRRATRSHYNPKTAVNCISVFFVNPSNVKCLQSGLTPCSIIANIASDIIIGSLVVLWTLMNSDTWGGLNS